MSWFDNLADIISSVQDAVNSADVPISTQPAPAATAAPTQSDVGSSVDPFTASPFGGAGTPAPAPAQDVAPTPATPQSLSRAIYTPSAIQTPSAWDALVHAAATGNNFNDVWGQMQDNYVNQMTNSRWSPSQNIASNVRSSSGRPTIQEYESHYRGPQQAPTVTPGAGPKVDAPEAHWWDGLFGGLWADGGMTGGISDTLPRTQGRDYHG